VGVNAYGGRLVKVASRALSPVADQAVQRGDHGAPPARGRELDLLPNPLPLHRRVGGQSQPRRAGGDGVIDNILRNYI
jgi:hypothetical protein